MAELQLSLGCLVELLSLPEVLEPSDLWGTTDGSELAPFRPNGKRGKVLGHRDGKYVIETFDAVVLSVPAQNLREYIQDRPAEGGFHLAWPGEGAEAEAAFAAEAMEQLRKEGYCVFGMSFSEQMRQKALQEAESLKFKRMRQEFEVAYLGRSHKCKTAFLDGVAVPEASAPSGLDSCDIHFSNLTKFMLPLAPCALDFIPYSRTNAMVRMPFASNAEEDQQRIVDVNDEDIEDGLVDNHVQFLKRRRIGMLNIVSTGGGELTLIHKDEAKENVVLETAKDRMVIFLTNQMTFIYNPFDKTDLVMQSWILQEPEQLRLVGLAGDQLSKDEATGIVVGPNTPDGLRTNVFGIGVGLPGGAHGTVDHFWALVAGGTDVEVKTPLTRYDMDFYSKDVSEWFPGYSYAIHGGYVTEDITAIDNKLFGIPEEECEIMAPAQRKVLEKGYEALYKSGLRQGKLLKGRRVGVFVGHSGDDWSFTQQFTLGWEDKYAKGHQNRVWACISARLSYVLGLKGPQSLADTACSSALVGYGLGHTMMRRKEPDQIRYGVDNTLNEALMCGANMIPGPGNYINLCGPHMLSGTGRCYTFDHSADGFARGEGVGVFYVKNEEVMSEASFATVIGACLNQDGRSASMTAPNGPAQQECIRGSMKEAGLSANQVTCAECHGTGTALGDPIEVGALRGVMQDRVFPIIQTSAKSHIGHLEASAGTAGIIKCMLMCVACAGTPNCHLRELNPHLDVNGYPTIFSNEICDYSYNSGYSGVSSFGFGGANSRADVFASAKRGPHVTGALNWEQVDYITVKCPFDQGPMHHLDGRYVPKGNSKSYQHQVYHADALRDEFDMYDYNSSLYKGEYQMAPRNEDDVEEVPTDPIYVIGSWDGFHEPVEMDADGEGQWTTTVPLGDTRYERFQLTVNKDSSQAIYPCAPNGSARTRCLGPDGAGQGHYWMIDGRDDEKPVGTVYQITFTWGSPCRMTWEAIDVLPPDFVLTLNHSYSILGSWTGGILEPMRNVSTPESGNTWEAKVRIGITNMEWFRFARDGDSEQQIYPAKSGLSENLQVCGPDDLCGSKRWMMTGKAGELVTLQLQVVDAHVIVKAVSNTLGTCKMASLEGPRRHSYHISGTFNEGHYQEMDFNEDTQSTFTFQGTMGASCKEYFHIAVDGDPDLAFVPDVDGAYPGDTITSGPHELGDSTGFVLYCLKPGAKFEIRFDRNAVDRRKVVDVKWLSGRIDGESMRQAYYNIYGVGVQPSMLAEAEVAAPTLA